MIKKILIALGILLALIFVSAIFFIVNITQQHKKLNSGELITTSVCDTIPFTYSNSGHMLIEARVNGSDNARQFILDSGASNMVFNKISDELGLENNGWGLSIGSSGNYFLSRIKELDVLQIGRLRFKNLSAKETDFDFDCQEHVAGLIGIGVMQHLVWQIDFKKQIIVVADSLEQLSCSPNSIEIPLRVGRYGRHLSADIKLSNNKRAKDVLVDLGSNRTLSLKINDVLKDSLNLPTKTINGKASKGLGKTTEKQDYHYYLADSVIFSQADYSVTNMPIGASTNSLKLLGLGFFENYKTTLSWKDKKMILEPYESALDFGYKTSGFSINYNDELNRVEIGTVTENSPAWRAGLEVGMPVTSLHGIELKDKASFCNFEAMTFSSDSVLINVLDCDGVEKEYLLVKEALFK